MRPSLGPLCPLGLVLLLSACSLTPEFRRPAAPVPERWSAPIQAEAPQPPSQWWRAFGSSELDRLEEQALAANNDLAAAASRIVQAEAQLRAAAAGLWPALSGSGGTSRDLRKAGSAKTKAESDRDSFSLGLAASYELDFWGKNRAASEAAEAGLDSVRFARETVALTLSADVASAYFTILALQDRMESARRQRDNALQVLAVVEAQARLGKISDLELAQQRGAVAQIEAALAGLDLQHRQGRSALALLLGVPVGSLALEGRSLSAIGLPGIDPGLPSGLLARRPDIRAAEANLRAANANIGVARAQLFPSIALTADGGTSSTLLSSLLLPSSVAANAAAKLTAPIFDGGRLRAGVDLGQARYDELVAAYRQAILAALRDVEDGLSGVALLEAEARSRQTAEDQAREAFRIAEARYRVGAIDFQTLLDTQRTLLQAEDTALQTGLARRQAGIGLFKALGGDFGAR